MTKKKQGKFGFPKVKVARTDLSRVITNYKRAVVALVGRWIGSWQCVWVRAEYYFFEYLGRIRGVVRIPVWMLVIGVIWATAILLYLLSPHPIIYKITTPNFAAVVLAKEEGGELESEEIRGYGYFYGSCVYGVSLLVDVPFDWGDASEWATHAKEDGWDVSKIPSIGAVAQDNWGLNGAGHVAVVIAVQGNGVQVREMNWYGGNGGWNIFSERWTIAGDWSWFISK